MSAERMSDLEQTIERIRDKARPKKLLFRIPLLEQEVVEFERRYEVQLPEEYREFLLRLGDGGSGPPSNGIDPLTKMRFPEKLKLPFPPSNGCVFEGPDEPFDDIALQAGNLRLGYDGCDQYWHLIVTGAAAGEVWYFTSSGVMPCYPRRTFLSWYEYWLDGGKDWWADYQDMEAE